MRQMPPRLFNVRGYDRSVYKTPSVIYTVIPLRGLETSASLLDTPYPLPPLFLSCFWYLVRITSTQNSSPRKDHARQSLREIFPETPIPGICPSWEATEPQVQTPLSSDSSPVSFAHFHWMIFQGVWRRLRPIPICLSRVQFKL